MEQRNDSLLRLDSGTNIPAVLEADSSVRSLRDCSFGGGLRRKLTVALVGGSLSLGASNEAISQNSLESDTQIVERVHKPFRPSHETAPDYSLIRTFNAVAEKSNLTIGTILIQLTGTTDEDRQVGYTPAFTIIPKECPEGGEPQIFQRIIPRPERRGVEMVVQLRLGTEGFNSREGNLDNSDWLGSGIRQLALEDPRVNENTPVSLLPVDRIAGAIVDRYSGDIIANSGSVEVTGANVVEVAMFLPNNSSQRFFNLFHNDQLGIQWDFTYAGSVQNRGVSHVSGSMNVSHEVDQFYDQEKLELGTPLLRGDRERFIRHVEIVARRHIETNDVTLLPFVLAASQDLIAERVFDRELILSRDELRDRHPEIHRSLAKHLEPEIAQFANSLREMDVEVEVSGERQGEEKSSGGGFRIPGVTGQTAKTKFKEQFEQLEKTTGVTFNYDEQRQMFLPSEISISSISRGEHHIDFSEVMSIVVSGPLGEYSHRTNIFQFEYTDAQLLNQLMERVGNLPSIPILLEKIKVLEGRIKGLERENKELQKNVKDEQKEVKKLEARNKILEDQKKKVEADLKKAIGELKKVYPELYK